MDGNQDLKQGLLHRRAQMSVSLGLRLWRNVAVLKSLGFCFLFMFSAVGCVSTGNNFPSRTEWIKKNLTSQKDIRMVLGAPFAVGDSGGILTWTYAYYRYVFPRNSFHKELKFYWNKNQTVKHFSFNSSFPADIQKSNLEYLVRQRGSTSQN